MVVIQRNGDGVLILRPAYIGFIKNNYLRRTLMVLSCPFILVLTFALNLIQYFLFCCILFLKSIFQIRKAMGDRWDKPRVK